MYRRRAKIVCTLGPACADREDVVHLVRAGMDVARVNLSHGTLEEHARAVAAVRYATDVTGRGVGIIADLQGPKIRLGAFAGGHADLVTGQDFVITATEIEGDAHRCGTTYAALPDDVRAGDLMLIDDGRIVVQVSEVRGKDIVTEVLEGGIVSDHKGINLPGVSVSVPAMSEKDVGDLRWALRTGVDMIALSFVRSADDVLAVRAVMDELTCRVPVLAKIEKPQAVECLDEIIDAFDGIMIARGDLGVELPLEDVPLVQKHIINACRAAGKPVIVATQMLESMVHDLRPSRAEVSDVANAVIDGADALMLSAETSVGVHPKLVVETMSRIILHVEEDIAGTFASPKDTNVGSTARALTRAACQVGAAVGATHLCTFTETGLSTRLVSRHRSPIPLIAFTPNPRVRSQLALVWGVETFMVEPARSTDHMVVQVDAHLLRAGRCQPGDRVVVVAGVPPGVTGTTNGMRVHVMGSPIREGDEDR